MPWLVSGVERRVARKMADCLFGRDGEEVRSRHDDDDASRSRGYEAGRAESRLECSQNSGGGGWEEGLVVRQ